MGQTESCSAPPYAHPQAKLVPGTSAATVPRCTAPSKVQYPRGPSPHADMGRTAARNDGDRAYFCTVCDHNFAGNGALQETLPPSDKHLLTHDPGYIRPPATVATPSEIVPESLSSGYCWVCDREFGTKLEKHLRLSALHRSRSIHPLPHNGRYRPDLWCNMCEVLFSHTDRKRKHVDEMHTHNSRLEQMSDAAAQHAMSSSHVSVTVSPAEGLHYCRPCDRYFSTAEELQQHQGLEDCGNENRRHRNANVRPSRAQLAPPRSDTTSAAPPPTPRRPSSRSPARPATEPDDVEDPFPPPPSYESILAEGPSPPHERERRRPNTSRRPRLSDPNPDHLLPALPAVSSSRELPPAPPSPPPKDLRPGLRPSRSAPSLQHPALECALCLEQETNVSALACGHIFGTSCINDALRDDQRCPICREPANVSDLRRIFLT